MVDRYVELGLPTFPLCLSFVIFPFVSVRDMMAMSFCDVSLFVYPAIISYDVNKRFSDIFTDLLRTALLHNWYTYLVHFMFFAHPQSTEILDSQFCAPGT